MTNRNLLNTKQNYQGKGFYQGQTFFLPDFSSVYEGSDLFRYGYIFGTIGALAHIGPDYGGMVWGSKGGADGAVRAARALYGTKGAQSDEDLRNAIRWADD